MVKINAINKCDISSIVKIHTDAFSDFFLTSLGDNFLYLYYSTFIKHPDGLLLGCYNDNGELLGFCAATARAKGFNISLIKKNLLRFIVCGMEIFFSNPMNLLRLLRNFSKKGSKVKDNLDYAELYSIAVRKDNQGKGIGKILLTSLEQELSYKVDKVSLTTDYYNNNDSILFYQKCGYSVLYDFTTYPNRKMYRFIKFLTRS